MTKGVYLALRTIIYIWSVILASKKCYSDGKSLLSASLGKGQKGNFPKKNDKKWNGQGASPLWKCNKRILESQRIKVLKDFGGYFLPFCLSSLLLKTLQNDN